MANTFQILTFGCKVNQYESQAISELFLKEGFKQIDNGLSADIYVLNTCTVTQKTDEECLRLARQLIRRNPRSKIIVTGCFVQDDKNIEELKNLSRSNLIIAKNSEKSRLPHIVLGKDEQSKASCERDFNISDFFNHSRAFLKIQDGCSNSCSYCKIPLVRGASRSRDPGLILDEAKRLIDKGFKEIVLCGICLGAFGRDLIPEIELTDLIEDLENINADFRIRLSSIEATDVTPRLIINVGRSEKICRHLHIPFQSGDDKILSLMNRKLKSDDYKRLIEFIRKKIPDIAITSDIMIGFPGEEDKNFKNTLDFLIQIQPSRLHIFPYSPRPGTASFSFPDRPSEKIVKERMHTLGMQAKILSFNYRQMFINKIVRILAESRLDKKTGLFMGYSDNYIRVVFDGKDELKNCLVPVRIEDVTIDYTKGQMKT